MTPVEVLKAAKALIDTPEKWHQGSCAANASGEGVASSDPDACRFCSFGAIGRIQSSCNDAYSGQVEDFLDLAAISLSETNVNMVTFNDTPGRTHAEIMLLFDEAIKLAEAEGAL